MSLLALRRRLPLVVFILLGLICLIVIGFACACATDHPSRSLERAVAAVPVTPAPPVELWPMLLPALVGALLLLSAEHRFTLQSRSPAQLQRFLL